MTVPSKEDINKRKQKLDKMLKSLNEDGSMPESKLCTQLRTAIRQVWRMHDVKVSYLMKKSYSDMNEMTRTKWLVDCECCKQPFKTNEVQVDHIKGEHSLKTFEDLLPFAESILGVSHEDLQVLCVPCHEARTYSERYGVSLEQAFKEKIIITKLNQKAGVQKKELQSFGYQPDEVCNEEKRKDCYRKLLEEGKI